MVNNHVFVVADGVDSWIGCTQSAATIFQYIGAIKSTAVDESIVNGMLPGKASWISRSMVEETHQNRV